MNVAPPPANEAFRLEQLRRYEAVGQVLAFTASGRSVQETAHDQDRKLDPRVAQAGNV